MMPPTRIEIDLGAIRHNLSLFRAHSDPRVQLMAVVKANAYGHGAIEIARAARDAGASWLGVAQLHEALELRKASISLPILVMGYVRAEGIASAIQHDLRFALFDADLARAAENEAKRLGRPARVHIKIDTGMGRLGVLPADVNAFFNQLTGLRHIIIEGMYTHFSCADCDADYTRQQIVTFEKCIAPHRAGRVVHACNSAGAMAFPQVHYDLVRVGVGLYGMNPFAPQALPPAFASLRPALRWVTRIAQVKDMPPNSAISYGATYRTRGEQRIAVIPVGYGDGFRRAPKFDAVLLHGQRCPIVGRVCMDNSMIDVTHVEGARADDEVVIIGRQGDAAITVEDIAAHLGTINYDVTTSLLARTQRSY